MVANELCTEFTEEEGVPNILEAPTDEVGTAMVPGSPTALEGLTEADPFILQPALLKDDVVTAAAPLKVTPCDEACREAPRGAAALTERLEGSRVLFLPEPGPALLNGPDKVEARSSVLCDAGECNMGPGEFSKEVLWA